MSTIDPRHSMVRKVSRILLAVPLCSLVGLELLHQSGALLESNSGTSTPEVLRNVLGFIGYFGLTMCLIPALLLVLIDAIWTIATFIRGKAVRIVSKSAPKALILKAGILFKFLAMALIGAHGILWALTFHKVGTSALPRQAAFGSLYFVYLGALAYAISWLMQLISLLVTKRKRDLL